MVYFLLIVLLLDISNRASTDASSSPVLIISELARPPKIKLTALIIIDFPAPVSPDKIFKLFSKLMTHLLPVKKVNFPLLDKLEKDFLRNWKPTWL